MTCPFSPAPRSWLCAALLTLVVSIPSAARAQFEAEASEPAEVGIADSSPSETLISQPGFTPAASYDDLLRRLEQTEARLQAMESQNAAASEERERASFVSRMQQRLTEAKDPSITTVDQQTHDANKDKEKPKAWYDRLSVRGYAQFRYNGELYTEDEGADPQHVGDRSVGPDQNFLIRRARLIISGDVSDHMYVYLQPDFASSVPGSPDTNQFAQIRDWYGDLYLDVEKVFRVRVGQSKIPYGWENLQSSSNRLPLDRNDALNSAVRNERDLGIFFYYTPEEAQDKFKYVLDKGLKGSGNYGVFALGVYNGQGGSLQEQNDNLHVITRLTYPFELPNGQIIEPGVQAYTGDYVVLSSAINPLGVGPAARPLGTLETGNRHGIRDERVAGTFVWYPQPLGFQAEWTVGNGPGLDPSQTAVVERALYGGYAMMMYRHDAGCRGTLLPFARWSYFQGGYKSERNAPFSEVDEWEFGVEWQFNPQMELVTQYTITDRTNTLAQSTGRSYDQYVGNLLRMQFQINY